MKKLLLTLLFLGLFVPTCFGATFYLDYLNGNDANTGADWANAWKTITLGATALRIAPADVIRIAKSPAPTSLAQTASWTNLSRAVVLQTAAVTANIDLCEAIWTASASVTATTSTTRKEGAYSASLAIAAAFTTGKVGYKALAGATNFSAYEQVSFWIRSSVAIAAGVLTLDLCSDAAGATSVNSIAIPAIPGLDRWQVVTVNTGGALGSAIASISINAISDPGIPTILIDNILACKALASVDSLTLSSLISKNSAVQGGTEGWFGIKSINGTAIQLDNDTNSGSGAGGGYSGETATVTTYKRETIKTAVVSAGGTVVQEVMDSGTAGSNIQFQGGYNTADSLQDGETFFDGLNGFGYGLQHSSKSYITLNYLNFSRYNYGVYYDNSHNNTITTLTNANNNTNYGVYYNNSHNNTITTLTNANNNTNYGVHYNNSHNNTITTLSNANNNSSCGVYYYYSHNNTITTLSNANNNSSCGVCHYNNSHNNTITTLSNANNNSSCGVRYDISTNNIIRTLSTTGNVTAGVFNNRGINYINNALIAEATEVTGYTAFVNSRIFSNKHDQTADNHFVFTDGGTINSQATTRHTASGIAWKYAITSANRASIYPLDMSIAKIAVTANNLVTVNVWVYKDSAAGVGAKLVCRGKQIAGVDSDVVATAADVLQTWAELTITFTPTEAGVVEIIGRAYYVSAASNVYFDDMTITQAGTAVDVKTMDYGFQAQPFVTQYTSGGGGGEHSYGFVN